MARCGDGRTHLDACPKQVRCSPPFHGQSSGEPDDVESGELHVDTSAGHAHEVAAMVAAPHHSSRNPGVVGQRVLDRAREVREGGSGRSRPELEPSQSACLPWRRVVVDKIRRHELVQLVHVAGADRSDDRPVGRHVIGHGHR